MICSKCGAECPPQTMFCTSCGASLENNQAQPQPQPPTQPGAPVYNPAPYPYVAPINVPGKGLGVASMVLGIISLVLFCFWFISIPCALISLILGIVGLSKAKSAGMNNGMAVAGIVCSAIALVLMVMLFIFGAVLNNELSSRSYYYRYRF